MAVFLFLMFISMFCRSRQIHNGFIVGSRIRRTLICAIYDKVSRLSVKSLSSINSGKLVSLVSSDLYQVEKPLGMLSMFLSAPILNLYAFSLIYSRTSWDKTLLILGF